VSSKLWEVHYAQLIDPLLEYSEEENKGLAILLASRTMQPTQFIPETRACFYLDQRLGQKSASEALEIEQIAEKLIDEWQLQDKAENES
jgi:hypothetical protein